MNEKLPNPSEQETPLRKFQREVADLALREKSRGGLHQDTAGGTGILGHFKESFNSEELDEQDMEFYNSFKTGTLNPADIPKRVEEIKKSGGVNESQRSLMSYIASQMQERMLTQR